MIDHLLKDVALEIADQPDRAFVAQVSMAVAGVERETAVENAEIGNGDLDVDALNKDDEA